MQPFSYTSLKVVHDSKIEEALKQQRFYAGQETRRQGVFQMCRRFLDRFINQFGGNKKGFFRSYSLVNSENVRRFLR